LGVFLGDGDDHQGTHEVKLSAPMKTSFNISTMLAVGLILLLAVGTTAAQKESSAAATPANKTGSVYAELGKAPKKAMARHNPMESDPEAVVAGGKLFELHCAECHGDMADGGKKGPSLRAEEVQQATPGTIFWVLTNGVVRRGMPVWSKLPEPQRWQIVSYIKSLTPAASPDPNGSKTPTEDKASSSSFRPPGNH
jgi:mono/diheme cytochrome c family protein